MDEHSQNNSNQPPNYDPVGETKRKFLFAALAIVILLVLKYGFGW